MTTSVKTRLATGDMTDMFWYNSGSLLQAIDPAQNLVPLTDEALQADVDQGFKDAVTFDGQVFGVPARRSHGRRDPVQQEGLRRPRPDRSDHVGRVHGEQRQDQGRWHRPGASRATRTPGRRSCSCSADFHNVAAANPDWAAQYTANDPKASTSDEPAIKGFQRLAEVSEAGYLNENFASIKFEQALADLAAGKGAQYPMLTFARPCARWG